VLRKNHPNYATLYQHLRKLVDDLEEYELKLIAQGGALTPDLLSAYQSGSRDNFHEFAKSVTTEQLEHKRISQDTYDAYYSSIGLFEKALGQLRFCDINETLVKKLDLFLTKNDYEQITIGKRHGTLKKFITAAEEKGLLDPRKNPYLNFEANRGESDRANLEPSELHSLEGLDRKKLINAALEQVYDRFLYSGYTQNERPSHQSPAEIACLYCRNRKRLNLPHGAPHLRHSACRH
jgi:hypothetical protein